MITLRCTKKLLKKLRLDGPLKSEPPSTLLGDWYANILYTRQGHFILCVSEKTLLPLVISARDIQNLVPTFKNQLRDVLLSMNIPDNLIEGEIQQMWPFAFSRIGNRSVLGSLNDFSYHFRSMILLDDSSSLLEFSLQLAEIPCGPFKYRRPIEITRELFKS